MNLARFGFLVPMLCGATLFTAACGQNALSSPTSPSALIGPGSMTADATAGATTGDIGLLAKGGNPGKGHEGDKGKDKDKEKDTAPVSPLVPEPRRDDKVVGFVTAVTGTSITVGNTVVTVAGDTVIRHGHRELTLADIQVGEHAVVRGRMTGTTFTATEIKVQPTGNDDDDDEGPVPTPGATSFTGTVAGLPGTGVCPALTFTIATTPVRTVRTTAATVFDDVLCAALANGAVVTVTGTTQADGSVLATKVEAQSGPNEVKGLISELTGTASCPALTFKVGTTTVTTSAATAFSEVTCAGLLNGTRVEVEGTLQANGSIAAASLELD
jgi:hypothetical protein